MTIDVKPERMEISEIQKLAGSLKTVVSEFVETLCTAQIDYEKESNKESIATTALHEFESACRRAEAETYLLTDKNIAKQICQEINDIKDESRLDIITYNRALLKFNRRKAKYENISPTSRQRSPPKSHASDVWTTEPEQNVKPERIVSMGGITGIIFFVIVGIIVGWEMKRDNSKLWNIFDFVKFKNKMVTAICDTNGYLNKSVMLNQWLSASCSAFKSEV